MQITNAWQIDNGHLRRLGKMETLLAKLLSILVEPTQIILVLACAYLIYDKNRLLKINDKMLLAQQERGVILSKIVVMIEAMFNESRRER